jgi:hypothetical protein
MSVKSSTELMLYVVLTMPTLNKAYLLFIYLFITNLCTFCKIHDETIEHLFFDCPVTQIFLKSLSKQLKQYYKNFIFDKKEYLESHHYMNQTNKKYYD